MLRELIPDEVILKYNRLQSLLQIQTSMEMLGNILPAT
jgi:hypothetical protein